MVHQNLFNNLDINIKTKMLLDFMTLNQFFQENIGEFYRLGILHKIIGNDKVLLHLGKKLDLSPESMSLLNRLTRQDFNFIRRVCDDFVQYAVKSLDKKIVECITASKLSAAGRKKLESGLAKMFAQEPMMIYKTDSAILGGSILSVDYIRFDSSYQQYFNKVSAVCFQKIGGEA